MKPTHWMPAALAVLAVTLVGCGQQSVGQTADAPEGTSPAAPVSSTGPDPAASDPGPGEAAITYPPVEFTACIPRNTPFRTGTEEQIALPSPYGDVTVGVQRGYTWRGTITATDDRLSGTHYTSYDANAYALPDGGNPISWAEAHRIENDEGAWQGSSVGFDEAGDDSETGPTLLIGEGAYEGLTAIISISIEGDCFINIRGFVMSVPPTRAPDTEG